METPWDFLCLCQLVGGTTVKTATNDDVFWKWRIVGRWALECFHYRIVAVSYNIWGRFKSRDLFWIGCFWDAHQKEVGYLWMRLFLNPKFDEPIGCHSNGHLLIWARGWIFDSLWASDNVGVSVWGWTWLQRSFDLLWTQRPFWGWFWWSGVHQWKLGLPCELKAGPGCQGSSRFLLWLSLCLETRHNNVDVTDSQDRQRLFLNTWHSITNH